MIVLETYEGKVCGGFTSQSWGIGQDYVSDTDAFVFNMQNNYTPRDIENAIYVRYGGGFEFGNRLLKLDCDPLNKHDGGDCSSLNHYNIKQDSEGKNPLTGKSKNFSCSKLEVFRIFFD